MPFLIYPPIGFARIGDSPEMFVGPETIGSRGTELTSGAQLTQYKDSQFRVRKQAARFHLFQKNADGSVSPAVLPAGAVVTWSVNLANRKDAVARNSGTPPGPITAGHPLRPVDVPARANRVIQATGNIASNAGIAAKQTLAGTHAGSAVTLGELRVDAQGKLLVLGGSMISAAHPGTTALTGDFYKNPDWHDDVSDGPVTATIKFADGHNETPEGAWVVVTPPDFAPGAQPIVTLFDEILQLALDQHWSGPGTILPARPSFTKDIYPIIRNARSLGWVHMDRAQPGSANSEPNWGQISQNFAQLSAAGIANHQLRVNTRDLIKNVTSLLSNYSIPPRKSQVLTDWVNGNFESDWTGVPNPATVPTAVSLIRSALEGAVGQGFFPGIEAGRILTDPSIYKQPFDFRLTAGVLRAGDVSALMAQPWQADFLKCSGNWWPSQRPDIAQQANGSFQFWARPPQTHAGLVQNVKRFGMIVVNMDANGVQISSTEQGRDPSLTT